MASMPGADRPFMDVVASSTSSMVGGVQRGVICSILERHFALRARSIQKILEVLLPEA